MSGQTKQAKVLTPTQVARFIKFLATETSFPERNVVIGLLSFRAGLRSKEIAGLRWRMVTNAEGQLGDERRHEDRCTRLWNGGDDALHADRRATCAALRHAHAVVEFQRFQHSGFRVRDRIREFGVECPLRGR